MMSYLLSSLVLLAFMFYLNWQLGLIAVPCDHSGVAGFQRDEQGFPAGSRWPPGAE